MTVFVNGEEKSLGNPGVTVLELLSMSDVESPDMVSVQLNGDIIKRAAFETTEIKENDEVEFLYFMGGGSL